VETVKERLKVYFEQTVPLLDYYQAQGKLVRVDGKLGIEDVSEAIITALDKK
jgi:adenylate kinase